MATVTGSSTGLVDSPPMTQFLDALLQWVAGHPHLAGVFVCLLAFSESLAGVGLLVPGALLMFGVGALIALGSLEFWPVYFWSVCGAILGDGFSYWLGRHFHQQIRAVWPFSRHPEWLEKGEAFFRRHGGKSVLLGRFIGPIRPVIPVVAGMLDMPPARFYLVNILSAFGWAPIYLLPGMAFGASLALAGEVAGRLALLLVSLLAGFWLLALVLRWLYRRLEAHAERWIRAVMLWGTQHRFLSWLVVGLVDPQRPVSRPLMGWLLVLILGAWLFIAALVGVLGRGTLHYVDLGFNQILQDLRNPLIDNIMVSISALGDWPVLLAVLATALGMLWWRGRTQETLYWLAAVVFGELAVLVFKAGLMVIRPTALYSGWEVFSFPSSHATMSVIIYGYLAASSAREMPIRWRWLPLTVGGLLIGGIAFSRLYLGAHWLSDVLAGLALGVGWVALSRIALRRHRRKPGTAKGLSAACLAVLVVVGMWHIERSHSADLQRYALREVLHPLPMAQWWRDAWHLLPVYREDLEGEYEQPLTLQWAGELATLRDRLRGAGWEVPPVLNWQTALRWLQPEPKLADLPLPPHLHQGRFESLLLRRQSADGRLLVLRLWPTAYRLQPRGYTLWVGTVAALTLRRLPLLSYPRSGVDYDAPRQALWSDLQGLQRREVRRVDPPPSVETVRWDGGVLLARKPLPKPLIIDPDDPDSCE